MQYKKKIWAPSPHPTPLVYEESNPRLVDYQPSWPKIQAQFPIILLTQQYFHLLHKHTYPVIFCNSSVCLALMYVFWLFSILIIASIHVMYTHLNKYLYCILLTFWKVKWLVYAMESLCLVWLSTLCDFYTIFILFCYFNRISIPKINFHLHGPGKHEWVLIMHFFLQSVVWNFFMECVGCCGSIP